MFSGIGVLVGGLYISKFKPSARFLTMWHVICGVFCVLAMISWGFLGCEESEKTLNTKRDSDQSCNADCHCDFVRYSPVCGDDGFTYTSACHAGCMISSKKNTSKQFKHCSCVDSNNQNKLSAFSWSEEPKKAQASSGPCKVNCQRELYIFLAILCSLKFIGATGRTSNFLVSIRCIANNDKSVAIGLGSTMVHLFAMIPSPILFGYVLDR